jgi:hypothetical protein
MKTADMLPRGTGCGSLQRYTVLVTSLHVPGHLITGTV